LKILQNEYFGQKMMAEYYYMRELDFSHKFHLSRLAKGDIEIAELMTVNKRNSKRL